MPDLEEAWVAAQDIPGGAGKFLREYASFTLLVIDEWLLDRPTESMRGMLLELMERRYGETGRARRCSAPSISRRAGTSTSAPVFTPTRSWTGSSTT